MASALLIKLTVLSAIISIAYSVAIYEQCAGEGYGTFPCDAGLACFRRNRFFSSCQTSCPRNLGWECETLYPVGPVGTIAAGWDQCGGDGWLGPRACAAGFTCYARSVFYSQCRPAYDCPADWTCYTGVNPTTVNPGPVILAAYAKCNNVGYAVCVAGTACFRNNDNYAECRPSCPSTWACATDVVGLNQQCGGDGYIGLNRCAAGYTCYARSNLYAECRATNDCPTGWICNNVVNPTTVNPGPVILAAYSKCNNVGYAVCVAGTACFRNNDNYSECRPSCPSTWACATDVVGLNQQCGGDGYIGLNRCAAGYTCYARSNLYAECRATNDCPTGWICNNVVSSTTVIPSVPVTLPAYTQCNNVGYAVCAAGTACFRSNANYSECRPSCPSTWACETDVAGLNEQCGGDGYVGLTRCAAGLGCYARSQLYAQCAASCPGAGWVC